MIKWLVLERVRGPAGSHLLINVAAFALQAVLVPINATLALGDFLHVHDGAEHVAASAPWEAQRRLALLVILLVGKALLAGAPDVVT